MKMLTPDFGPLDEAVKGICRKAIRARELTVIAGAKETHKSKLVEDIVTLMWGEGTDVVYLVQDEGYDEYIYQTDAGKLFSDKRPDEGYYFAKAKRIPFQVLISSLKRLRSEKKFELIILDGVEILGDVETQQDRSDQVQDLKNYAKDIDAGLLITIRLHDSDVKPPELEHLGKLFYPGIADNIVFVYDSGLRDDFGNKKCRAAFAKNKSGHKDGYDFIIYVPN